MCCILYCSALHSAFSSGSQIEIITKKGNYLFSGKQQNSVEQTEKLNKRTNEQAHKNNKE